MSAASETSPREPVAIAVALVRQGDTYLVGTRGPESPLPGLSEFPGGKVQPGEAPADAAVRECLEETGVPVRCGALVDSFEHQYPHALVRLHFYQCEPVTSAVLPKPPFRWVSRGELVELNFPPANASILARLASAAFGDTSL